MPETELFRAYKEHFTKKQYEEILALCEKYWSRYFFSYKKQDAVVIASDYMEVAEKFGYLEINLKFKEREINHDTKTFKENLLRLILNGIECRSLLHVRVILVPWLYVMIPGDPKEECAAQKGHQRQNLTFVPYSKDYVSPLWPEYDKYFGKSDLEFKI